jgi:hypothetical protein
LAAVEEKPVKRSMEAVAFWSMPWIVVALAAALGAPWAATPLAAQEDPVGQRTTVGQERVRVQLIEGEIESRRIDFYRVLGLKAGDTLYAHLARTSGNLDPFVAVSDTYYQADGIREAFWGQADLVMAQGADLVEALPEIYDDLFLAWDDDSGEGYAAAMVYEVTQDGDHHLMVTFSPGNVTFGSYRLLLGVNEPEVLQGSVQPTGSLIAIHDRDVSQVGQAVQVVDGTLAAAEPEQVFPLVDLAIGDDLGVYAESQENGLVPVLVLEDYGGKPIASDNVAGLRETALLVHRFGKLAKGYQLRVSGFQGGSVTSTGNYRLVFTVNAPKEATSGAISRGLPIVKEAIKVKVGMKLQQITDVDQVSENYGAVAELTMDWQDPLLAFSPDTCNCRFEVFTGDSFAKYAEAAGIDWPQFTLYNQQGNRWVQNRNVVLWPEGRVRYVERFTTDFQAPDFDFAEFPFDTQTLYMRVHSLYSEEYFVFEDPADLSGIGEQLGEEEWEVVESSTEITTQDGTSQFALRFLVARYLQFYIFRIFVPIVLIIIVSWFTFFLKDYGKRVDVAGANLLVFVAFNFTVSGELPRLGYLTFMDSILIGVFVISAFVVVFNVFLKRLELADKRHTAERIDRFSIWVYPLAYGTGVLVAYLLFLA